MVSPSCSLSGIVMKQVPFPSPRLLISQMWYCCYSQCASQATNITDVVLLLLTMCQPGYYYHRFGDFCYLASGLFSNTSLSITQCWK
uniref:Uncharacterized protein n=1 Tax=Salmo trutta TaxID=8032 RepID=A0A674DV22_SALTR